ncbi:PREDICTED: interleukin-6 receptor subunit beta [Nanorana parkeri]|uniref:interleukin-6 receptor subunit beta n=1 Tax=Nanorana parkeri TaxID=125878 RepID=UPI000853F6DE|nr:PREDICTED: interleukin-6 receptor subunit beta [Nanorana parkeri]
MILIYILCFSTIIIATGSSSVMSCFSIGPQIPLVEFYSNVTAYCVLNQTCLLEMNSNIMSDELYWEVNGQSIPKSQYSAINETTSRVTFQPTLTSANMLTCSTDLHGQIKTTLIGMFISKGFPPEKPKNLSCICYNKDKLTCTWSPGRATVIPTTYTLKQSWKEEKRPDCVSEGSDNCTLYFPNFHVFIDTTFQVVAKNELGTAESDELRLDVVDILKPNPPEIVNVFSLAQLQRALKIEWTNPLSENLFPMKYNLRYRKKDSTEWAQVPPNDIDKPRNSYTLQDLQPYTNYLLSLRCKRQNDKGYWSDWSKEYAAITPESVWRKIGDSDGDGNRTVWLMWKDLESYANGKILGYNLTIKTAKELIDAFSINDTRCNVTVRKDAVQVIIIAYNSYGVSPSSSLVIPSARNTVTLSSEIDVKAFPKDGKLWVEWSAPTKPFVGYVIEWCANPDSEGCKMEWQREPSTVNGTFLRGDLKPFVYYMIKVYPLYKDGLERPRYVAAYLQQGTPEEGPTVRYKSVEKTRAVIVWEPVPLEKQYGFITKYTLKYEAKNGPEKTVTLNATQTEYTMTSLTSNTVYSVSVKANTEIGGKEGLPFTFSTNRFDTGEVEAIVVSSCIGFLLLVLVVGVLLCNKRDFIKKHIWPNVPDPSKSNIAQWSPQTPTRHEPKGHPFQDGSFTDVSVVEITADEKSSYNKQDLKSVDVIKKNTSEGLSSGIGGSSCLSSLQLSISDTDEVESGQNTSSTVQYSTVIISGYRGQQPTAATLPTFSRSESTQPLLESEERPDEQQVLEIPNQYFKQNCTQEDSTGRLQALQQENLSSPIQELGQSQHLAGLGHEMDLGGFNAEQNVSFESEPSAMNIESTEIKSYLPQTVRRGGYLPQ